MAFSIYIYEKNKTIFDSLKMRLSHYFPEAYIVNPFDKSNNHKEISEFIIVLYDGFQYTEPVSKGKIACEYINLFQADEFGNKIIDCSRLSLLIKNTVSNIKPAASSISGKTDLLISFSYIDERENFINQYFLNHASSELILRLDLMSGIRMPSIFKTGMSSGSLTELLELAKSDSFTPETILDFLNPDSQGFLTPGKPNKPDDVFDVDIYCIINLLKNFHNLTHQTDVQHDGLVVCEGWKMQDLINFSNYSDAVHILLPSRMCDEAKGSIDFINNLKRHIDSNKNLTLHYCEDYRNEAINEKSRV
ncbi:MAG: hypothetical protein MJ093_06805 [Saccharofermentans sp.]|nr:hypothetical protein [Saccharofermentans sp.]